MPDIQQQHFSHSVIRHQLTHSYLFSAHSFTHSLIEVSQKQNCLLNQQYHSSDGKANINASNYYKQNSIITVL